MLRREFVRLLAKITGGTVAVTLAPPLLRINTALLAEAACVNQPQLCGTNDCCTVQDNCGTTDTTGHTCTNQDLCDVDASGSCDNDQCQQDASSSCTNDLCTSDSSGTCGTDRCEDDSSGGCTQDSCSSDKSGSCSSDQCQSDKSSSCLSDTCISDSSGACVQDQCETDSTGSCQTDQCLTDSSGSCQTDRCISDSSGACTADLCELDSSASCQIDRCNSDSSDTCNIDVCLLDLSSSCQNDLCREDRSPIICETDISCINDTCSLDLALNLPKPRRDLAKAGLNLAIKWLYKLSVLLLVLSLASGTALAATVIDARNAVFHPAPTFSSGQAVTVQNPVGPFLRDCDGDGLLEADTNGDGQCQGDPKIIVMDNTGGASWGLPAGAAFTGSFEFTCFHVSYRMAIVSTGPLTIKASQEVAIFGAMRLVGDTVISTPAAMDFRASAWLSDGTITFITSQAGEVDETQTAYAADSRVPPIFYDSLCGRIDWGLFLPLIKR